MKRFRLLQLSDPHLSGTHPLFHHNWEVTLQAVAGLAPDAVVVTGDVSYNGPDHVQDLDFARAQIARIKAPIVKVLPGNHDVGVSPVDPNAEQPMTPQRRQIWLDRFGPDFWHLDMGAWRFVGLNPFLADSGHPAEAAQTEALKAALDTAKGPVGIFTHMPLFLADPAERISNGFNMPPGPRKKWLDTLEGRARFIASGHLHKGHSFQHGETDYHWCPATSFMQSNGDPFAAEATPWVGFLVHDFNGHEHHVTRAAPQDMINMDIRTWADGPEHSYMRIARRPFLMPRTRR